MHLLKHIEKINDSNISSKNATSECFRSFINLYGPKKVLTQYKFIFKKDEFRKSLHYSSNTSLVFIPYLNFPENLEILGKFNYVLLKVSNLQELETQKEFIEAIKLYIDKHPSEKFKFINNIDKIKNYFDKDLMCNSMQSFVQHERIININKQYNTNLTVPLTHATKLQSVLDMDCFNKFIESNKLSFPVIVKHTGILEYNNLMVIILNADGIKNYLDLLKSTSENYDPFSK